MFGGQIFEIELDTWVVLYQAFIMNFRLQVLLKKFHHSVSQWQMILDLGSGTVWALRDTISRKELVNRNRSLGPKQSTFPASLLNTYTLKYMKTYILFLCHLFTFIKLFYFYNFLIEITFDWFKKKEKNYKTEIYPQYNICLWIRHKEHPTYFKTKCCPHGHPKPCKLHCC